VENVSPSDSGIGFNPIPKSEGDTFHNLLCVTKEMKLGYHVPREKAVVVFIANQI
jgi:hypothetical protein